MASVILNSFWLRRPLFVATWIYVVLNADKFDDVKFATIVTTTIAIFIIDILSLQGGLKEVVKKALETGGKLKGMPIGND